MFWMELSSRFLLFPSLVRLSKKSMTGSSCSVATIVAGFRAVELDLISFESFMTECCINSSDSLNSFVRAWKICRLDVSESLSSYCNSARQFCSKHDIKLAQQLSVRYLVISCKMLVISIRLGLERRHGNVLDIINDPLDAFVYWDVKMRMLLKSEE